MLHEHTSRIFTPDLRIGLGPCATPPGRTLKVAPWTGKPPNTNGQGKMMRLVMAIVLLVDY